MKPHLIALLAATLAPMLALALGQEAPPEPVSSPGRAVTAPVAVVAAPVAGPVTPPAALRPVPSHPAAPAAQASVAKPPATPSERRARAARIDALEAAVRQRLASPAAERIFRKYNATHGRQIQHHLADVYGKEPAFVADAGGVGRPLGDSIVGPVTLRWLGRFCADYGIVASDPQFEQEVVASLEQVAAIARAHPDWQNILFSADFEAWINEQPSPQRIRNLKIRRSGAAAQVNALIEQYLQARRPAAAAAPMNSSPIEVTYVYDPRQPAAVADFAAIAQRLQGLVGRAPADEAWFVDDVREAMGGMALSTETLHLIKRYAQVDVYMVRPALIVRLRKEGLGDTLVTTIQEQMGGIEFGTVQEFVDALDVVADASDDPQAIRDKARWLVREARFPRYRVPATLAADLAADAPLEAPLAALFAGIANIDYPTKALFDKALQFQVQRALHMCPQPRGASPFPLDDTHFEALALLPPVHDDIFARIRQLRAARNCSAEQLMEADALAYQAYRLVAPRLDRKMRLEAWHAASVEKKRASSWAIANCRCGRPARQGMVYGFYPLWTQAGERQIDFGALTRIGLYGVNIDERGELRPPPRLSNHALPENLAELMVAAHRHRVAVDWVLGRSSWSTWAQHTPAQKKAFFRRLEQNIVDKLDQSNGRAHPALTRLASLGADRGATAGDGVVLYLRHFPAADKELFNEFVRSVWVRLQGMTPARSFALMVDYTELATPGPFEYRNLHALVSATNKIDAAVSFADSKDQLMNDMPILLVLPEPTQESKQNLRAGVQDVLHGTESLRLLRDFVPVVAYDGRHSQQLADDIVYVSENYFGIGFWPLPFASTQDGVGHNAGESSSIVRLLELYYQPNGDPLSRWDRTMSYLCPHRLWLRYVAWLALFVAAGVAWFYLRCRGCNERFDNSLVYSSVMVALMALPLLALFVLVLGDPVLEPYAPVLLVLYGTSGLVLAALVARYYFNKSRRKVP
ncbi:hypothetical protein [Pseudoduganella chitinolytica]|uniref:Uncharacterized protein n=1 Tax=Pseudoduganella chitinolytica TaxID=34070 RepID=A0ABY8BEP3_9BURK|nr:hypothetical protein [Pseudoduganella chitinolytica]WEF34315.1 hypothetical protein PX653_05950 [Pseudoduganella chitinolytica]